MLNPKSESDSNNISSDSEDMRGVRSSGRESYVFRANKPGGLLGVHADLMEEALRPDEGLLYLLYSPIFQEKKAHFGLHATPASHAVAVTGERFIISEDRHRKGIAPTIQSIPFDQVLYVELGNAFLLGWFSVELVFDDKPSSTTLFFSATTGMKHFDIAVSEYRRMTGFFHNNLPAQVMNWTDIWQHTPKIEVDHLKPLILGEELPLNVLRSSERWISRQRRWKSIPVCLSTNGIFVSTNFGFVYATEEQPVRPEMYTFGVNVSCIPINVVESARLVEKRMYGGHLFVLRVEIARGAVTVDFDIPFDESSLKDAESLIYFLNQGRRLEGEACIS